MNITIYNDQPELLHPFTHLRPTWDVVVGGRTLRTFLERELPDATIEYKNQPLTNHPLLSKEGHGVVYKEIHISGRTIPSNENINNIHTGVLQYAPTLDAPWKLITHHDQILREEIQSRIQSGNYTKIRNGVYIPILSKERRGEVYKQLNTSIISNTENGPIIIGSVGAKHVQPIFGHHIVLKGPLIIESGCTIKNFSDIKGSYIGHVCKIGGEVSNSNFFGYSNKVHHGFVGDSAIAEWVNFGAGATTSNMKNTYGHVRIQKLHVGAIHESPSSKVDTDLQFLGSLIGDHTKIAINATLMTGTVLGTCVHAYDTVYGTVPSFTQIFRGQRAELPLEVALKITDRSMQRRDQTLSEDQKKTLQDVFEKTLPDRNAFNVKQNTKLSFE